MFLVTEDALHYLLHCHHFSQYRFDLMNSVKSGLDKFESLPDNDKKDLQFLDYNYLIYWKVKSTFMTDKVCMMMRQTKFHRTHEKHQVDQELMLKSIDLEL